MRSIRVHEFGGPEVMKLEQVADPTPASGQILVRIRAAGVNPVDAYIRSGTYPRKPQLSYTPGFDGAGEVAAVGPNVNGFSIGDRVYIAGPGGPGTYAEYGLYESSQLFTLPARISFGQGASLGVPYATAYRSLFHRAAARPAESVLVHGATGGVGIAAVQLARAHGMFVIGTGGTDEGLKTARAHGAQIVVNHRTPNYTDEIMKATGGRGVDVILEMATHVNLGRDLTLLARSGRVVVIGSRGPIEINPRDAMGRDAAILGMTLFNATQKDLVEIHAAIVAGLSNGTLNPVVRREMPLADAARAHEAVMEAGALGKIVLTP